MVGLDRRRGAFEAHTFDDIGIQRALYEIFDTLEFFGFDFKILDEQTANDFPLPLRISYALQPCEELARTIEDPHVQMELRGECPFDLITLAGPQHSVIDEDAGQLIANGLMRQSRRNR